MPRRTTGQAVWLAVAMAFAISMAALPADGQVAIQPAFVELDLAKGRPSGRFVVTNITEQEQQFRITARFFDYSDSGALVFPDQSPRSLASFIKFSPTEFTIPAKASRAVRFAVVRRGALADGEYWAAMGLEQLAARQTRMDVGQGRTVNLQVSTALLVPIFGSVGEIRYSGKLEKVALVAGPTGPVLQAVVANTGTGRLVAMGKYRLLDGHGQVAAEGGLGHSYIMAGQQRIFTVDGPADLALGRYKLEVSYKFDRMDDPLVLTADAPWTGPAPVPAPDPTPASPDHAKATADNPAAASAPGL
jgi:hypothetical protein